MEKPRPSSIAWASVIGGIYLYDRLCPSGEQLSERADEWTEHPVKRRVLELGALALALHITNRVKPQWDFFHYLIPEKLDKKQS